MRRSIHILVFLLTLPGMLTGLGADRVLCISTDGHIAIEPAELCEQITCAPAFRDAALANQPLQQPIFSPSAGCDPCVDIPVASSLGAAICAYDPSAHSPLHLAPPLTVLPFALAEIALPARFPHLADISPDDCAFLRTSILLI